MPKATAPLDWSAPRKLKKPDHRTANSAGMERVRMTAATALPRIVEPVDELGVEGDHQRAPEQHPGHGTRSLKILAERMDDVDQTGSENETEDGEEPSPRRAGTSERMIGVSRLNIGGGDVGHGQVPEWLRDHGNVILDPYWLHDMPEPTSGAVRIARATTAARPVAVLFAPVRNGDVAAQAGMRHHCASVSEGMSPALRHGPSRLPNGVAAATS